MTRIIVADQYWTIRLARPDETDAVLELVRAVHGERYPKLNRSYWQWRYLRSGPFRADILVAEHGGRIIGIQPVTLFDFLWDEQLLKGAMYTGVLTHPAHRRRGVFRSLVLRANEHAAGRGAHFSVTMPNDASLPGFRRFGDWIYPGPIPLYMKAIDGAAMLRLSVGRAGAILLGRLPRAMLSRRRTGEAELPMVVEIVNHVPNELDNVAEKFADNCTALHILRSAAYWNWRYFNKPASMYRTLLTRLGGQVVGAVVTSVQRRFKMDVGIILDLIASDGPVPVRTLLRIAEQDFISRGLGLITCQATTPLLQQALINEGYVRPPVRLLPKRFHYVYRRTGVPGMLRNPENVSDWHLTFGDSDNA